jgi:hypothetical protein
MLLGKGTIGRKACFSNDNDFFNKAHLPVLQQSTLVTPYIEEHKQIISSQNPTKTEAWVTRHHMENFPSWLSEQVIGESTIHPQLALLARGCSSTIVKFQAYDINGYTFYTRDQDRKTTHQNSGVRIDTMDNNNNKNSYYGVIEEIWELEYGPLNIPLFLCQWVKLTGGGIRKDQYGMTIVDLTKIGFKDEPFVLAKNAHQVFYVKDMTSKPKNKNPEEGPQEPKRHIVLPGKRVIVGVEDKIDKSDDYDQFDGMPPFTVEVDPSIPVRNEETPYLRHDHNQGTFVEKRNFNTIL